MKLKKSKISFVLVITMLFTLIGSTMVSADTLDYSNSLSRMQELGIIDSSLTDINSVVTRGQLLKSIIAAEGLNTTAENSQGSTIFPDVQPYSDLSGYVNAGLNIGSSLGVNQGVVYGTPSGDFQPDKAVTYGEACTMMVRLLGYADTDKELQTASWPNNYIQEAATLNLTTDISLKKYSQLTLGAEAVLLDRVFDSLMKKTATSTQDKFFSDNYFGDSTVTGTLKEVKILGNSKTSDNLLDNQILTDLGTFTLNIGVKTPEVGGKYKLYVDGTNVTKVTAKENTLQGYAVKNAASGLILYTDSDNTTKTMTLPQANAYYYHGSYVSYATAAKSIQSYSSIVLAKSSDNSGYDYGIIVDPNFGKPYVYKNDNTELQNMFKNTKYDYMYRDANITEAQLNAYDVVYFVSDLWNKNTFVYVNDKTAIGTITAFVGGLTNPTGVTINGKTYTFSPYFDKTRLNNYDGNIGNFVSNTNVGDFRTLVLGVDGTIVDMY